MGSKNRNSQTRKVAVASEAERSVLRSLGLPQDMTGARATIQGLRADSRQFAEMNRAMPELCEKARCLDDMTGFFAHVGAKPPEDAAMFVGWVKRNYLRLNQFISVAARFKVEPESGKGMLAFINNLLRDVAAKDRLAAEAAVLRAKCGILQKIVYGLVDAYNELVSGIAELTRQRRILAGPDTLEKADLISTLKSVDSNLQTPKAWRVDSYELTEPDMERIRLVNKRLDDIRKAAAPKQGTNCEICPEQEADHEPWCE